MKSIKRATFGLMFALVCFFGISANAAFEPVDTTSAVINVYSLDENGLAYGPEGDPENPSIVPNFEIESTINTTYGSTEEFVIPASKPYGEFMMAINMNQGNIIPSYKAGSNEIVATSNNMTIALLYGSYDSCIVYVMPNFLTVSYTPTNLAEGVQFVAPEVTADSGIAIPYGYKISGWVSYETGEPLVQDQYYTGKIIAVAELTVDEEVVATDSTVTVKRRSYAYNAEFTAVTGTTDVDVSTFMVGYDEKITVEASSEDFLYWEVNGRVASMDSSYTFSVFDDVTVIEVTKAMNEGVDTGLITCVDEPRINTYNVNPAGGALVAAYHLPEGYSCVEFGWLSYGTNHLAAERVSKVNSANSLGEFGLALDTSYHFDISSHTAYVVYIDLEGNYGVAYSILAQLDAPTDVWPAVAFAADGGINFAWEYVNTANPNYKAIEYMEIVLYPTSMGFDPNSYHSYPVYHYTNDNGALKVNGVDGYGLSAERIKRDIEENELPLAEYALMGRFIAKDNNGYTSSEWCAVSTGAYDYTPIVGVAIPKNAFFAYTAIDGVAIDQENPDVADVGLPALACDDNAGTRWESKGGGDLSNPYTRQYVLDMAIQYEIDKVTIMWEGACASEYTLDVSLDGEEWTTVDIVTGGTGGLATHNFSTVTARFIRVNCTQRALAYGYSIFEITPFAPAE